MNYSSTLLSGKTKIVQVVVAAITTHQVIQVRVKESWRTLEPYLLGKQKRNRKELILYAYCRDIVTDLQTRSRWQRFRIDEIERIEITFYSFTPNIEYTKPKDLI